MVPRSIQDIAAFSNSKQALDHIRFPSFGTLIRHMAPQKDITKRLRGGYLRRAAVPTFSQLQSGSRLRELNRWKAGPLVGEVLKGDPAARVAGQILAGPEIRD